MCRMIYINSRDSNTVPAKMAKMATRYWATRDGQRDGVGIAWTMKGVLNSIKFGGDAETLFTKKDKVPKTILSKNVLAHVRISTGGTPCSKNSHPFFNMNGTLALTHNGWLVGYYKLKAHLETLGYVFKSNVDSEVLIHAIEEWGIKQLPEVLNLWRVTGKVNVLLMDREGKLWAYSDGDLYYRKTLDGVIVATNMYPFAEKKKKSAQHIKAGSLMVVDNVTNTTTTEFIGEVHGGWNVSSLVATTTGKPSASKAYDWSHESDPWDSYYDTYSAVPTTKGSTKEDDPDDTSPKYPTDSKAHTYECLCDDCMQGDMGENVLITAASTVWKDDKTLIPTVSDMKEADVKAIASMFNESDES